MHFLIIFGAPVDQKNFISVRLWDAVFHLFLYEIISLDFFLKYWPFIGPAIRSKLYFSAYTPHLLFVSSFQFSASEVQGNKSHNSVNESCERVSDFEIIFVFCSNDLLTFRISAGSGIAF